MKKYFPKNLYGFAMRMTALALCIALLGCFAACGDDGSLEEYLQNNNIQLQTPSDSDTPAASPGDSSPASNTDAAVSGADASPTTTTTTTTTTTKAPADSTLPEEFIGSWTVVGIYQAAGASDISEEEALRREKLAGISFSYNSFIRYDEAITNANFIINRQAKFSDMQAFGIETTPLSSLFGADAQITSIEVRTADGNPCTTVFLVNSTMLIAFGQGMNIFSYELMEAVG